LTDNHAQILLPESDVSAIAETQAKKAPRERPTLASRIRSLPAPEAAAIISSARVTLNQDGSLASAQFVSVINDDPALERYERRMRDIALNVINACTPIRGLPAEFYDVPGGWRSFPYQFDPRTVR